MAAKKLTLKEAAQRFTKSLPDLGKKPATVMTAERMLEKAIVYFGEERDVGALRPADIGRYFVSDAMLKSPKGKARAKLSVLQQRRVFRQFLIWCFDEGLVKTLPLPKEEATRGGVKASPAVEPAEGPRRPNDELAA